MSNTDVRVSTTCEVYRNGLDAPQCGKPAVRGYPADGGGYFMMCNECSQPHARYCVTLEQAQRGETLIDLPSEETPA